MSKLFKVTTILILSLILTTSFGCSKKKGIEDIRKEFDAKPSAKYLSKLKKFYKKKGDTKALLEISEKYFKAFPKDPYIKEDMGKIYSEIAKTKKGEERLALLMKAVDFGFTSDTLSKNLSDLVIQKIAAYEKAENQQMLGSFLLKVKKLPLNSDVRTTVLSKLDFLKNKKVFDPFYIPWKENFEKNSDKFIKTIFKKGGVKYDKNKGVFTIQYTVPVKNNVEKAKAEAFYQNDHLLTILKYAIEHNRRPPVGKEFGELPFPKEDFKCESAIMSENKKDLTLTCNLTILDLGKALFAVRKDSEKNSKEKKDTKSTK